MVQLYSSTKCSRNVVLICILVLVSTTSGTWAQTVYCQSPSKKFDQGHSLQIGDMQPTRTAKGRFFACYPVIWCNLIYQTQKVPLRHRSLIPSPNTTVLSGCKSLQSFI